MTDRPYLALSPGTVYYLDGVNHNSPDWHRLHVALSRVHRFHGYSSLSVLHHAFAVRWLLAAQGYDAVTQRLGFLHDHHEALVGDVPTPIKRAMYPAWGEFERPAERYVRRWFDLDGADEKAVRAADVGMCYAEAIREGIASYGDEWLGGFDRNDMSRYLPHLEDAAWYGGATLVEMADSIVENALMPRA